MIIMINICITFTFITFITNLCYTQVVQELYCSYTVGHKSYAVLS